MNFCKTKQKVDPPKQSKDGSCVSRDRSAGSSAEPTCSNCKPVSGAGVHSENSCQSSAASAVASKRDSAVNHMVLAEETTEFGASLDHVEPADKDGIEGSHVDTEIPADEILQDGWSCLKYIEVDVEGLTDKIRKYHIQVEEATCDTVTTKLSSMSCLFNLSTMSEPSMRV